MPDESQLIVAIMNKKGGVGKTTLADELLFSLARRGRTCGFLTTDPQAGGIHEPTKVTDADEFVIVDTHGGVDAATNDVIMMADVVIVPVEPSVKGLPSTLQTITMVESTNPSARVFVVLNRYVPREVASKAFVEVMRNEAAFLDKPVFVVPRRAAFQAAETRMCSVVDVSPAAAQAFDVIADCLAMLHDGQPMSEVMVSAAAARFYVGREVE